MERTVNSKTTKSKIVRIGSIYAVPVINEETLTYWDQQFLVYDHQDPKVIAKKYQEIRLGSGYSVDLNGIYYVKDEYIVLPNSCNEMENYNDDKVQKN